MLLLLILLTQFQSSWFSSWIYFSGPHTKCVHGLVDPMRQVKRSCSGNTVRALHLKKALPWPSPALYLLWCIIILRLHQSLRPPSKLLRKAQKQSDSFTSGMDQTINVLNVNKCVHILYILYIQYILIINTNGRLNWILQNFMKLVFYSNFQIHSSHPIRLLRFLWEFYLVLRCKIGICDLCFFTSWAKICYVFDTVMV